MTAPTVRRPGMVTFIAVILYIKAAMAAVAAIVILAFSASTRVQDAVGLGTGGLVLTGIVEAAVAILLLLVAGGIMRGSRGFRLFVAIVVGIRMVTAVAVMLVHHTGGYLFSGLVMVLLGAFVLWALYGYQPSDDYFNGRQPLSGQPA